MAVSTRSCACVGSGVTSFFKKKWGGGLNILKIKCTHSSVPIKNIK